MSAAMTRRLREVHAIADLRDLAARRLPSAIFDTIDGGAGDEQAAERNLRALRDMTLSPRVLVDVESVDISLRVLGKPIAHPVMLAPTGLNGLYHPGGEAAVSRAAEDTIHVLSTFSSVPLERVAQSGTGRRWFQIYPFKSRETMGDLLQRARRHGYEALCVTVDTPVVGPRRRDQKNGLQAERLSARLLASAALHPRWAWPFLRGHRPRLACLQPYATGSPQRWFPLRVPEIDAAFGWNDLAWLIKTWAGPVVVKGILRADDAQRAFETGADAIIVSNHGGRQFEAAPSAIKALTTIRAHLGSGPEIYVDGGIRSGTDVLRYLVAGADACLCGRAYLYGLAAAGEAGVRQALEILRTELTTAMALAGIVNLDEEGLAALREVGIHESGVFRQLR